MNIDIERLQANHFREIIDTGILKKTKDILHESIDQNYGSEVKTKILASEFAGKRLLSLGLERMSTLIVNTKLIPVGLLSLEDDSPIMTYSEFTFDELLFLNGCYIQIKEIVDKNKITSYNPEFGIWKS